MIGNVFGIIWVILIIAIAFFLIKKAGGGEVVYFQLGRKPDVPYIVIKSGNVSLNMIVDTGCGASIIDKSILNSLEYQEMDETVNLSALTSDSVNSKIVAIPLTIKGKQIMQKVAPIESCDIANFRALYGVTSHGLLGSDFMETTGCHIDYKKGAVIFP